MTMDNQHTDPVAKNVLDRHLIAMLPTPLWVTDTAGVCMGGREMDVVLDLFSHSVVGWTMGAHRDAELVE